MGKNNPDYVILTTVHGKLAIGTNVALRSYQEISEREREREFEQYGERSSYSVIVVPCALSHVPCPMVNFRKNILGRKSLPHRLIAASFLFTQSFSTLDFK
jgi:hypothetical protein